ncbi:uncharacterized protein HMPREF1541_10260 [Cyphellophora europaea CBS 101466]|uniref:Uncharacterized protein n=1 Tax=Cyphellophora europaea (strain CBS 101466) TaxID=1220924 RepID=W2S7I1_CYPE1|nr:uncharacterized protein HMPREF1541_10260 [Cyphellophora europaea CBS 101466]ETN44590.1 hypothetical protein HMPREF1541_10260 [Cyphellophora europaea CBS 101466]
MELPFDAPKDDPHDNLISQSPAASVYPPPASQFYELGLKSDDPSFREALKQAADEMSTLVQSNNALDARLSAKEDELEKMTRHWRNENDLLRHALIEHEERLNHDERVTEETEENARQQRIELSREKACVSRLQAKEERYLEQLSEFVEEKEALAFQITRLKEEIADARRSKKLLQRDCRKAQNKAGETVELNRSLQGQLERKTLQICELHKKIELLLGHQAARERILADITSMFARSEGDLDRWEVELRMLFRSGHRQESTVSRVSLSETMPDLDTELSRAFETSKDTRHDRFRRAFSSPNLSAARHMSRSLAPNEVPIQSSSPLPGSIQHSDIITSLSLRRSTQTSRPHTPTRHLTSRPHELPRAASPITSSIHSQTPVDKHRVERQVAELDARDNATEEDLVGGASLLEELHELGEDETVFDETGYSGHDHAPEISNPSDHAESSEGYDSAGHSRIVDAPPGGQTLHFHSQDDIEPAQKRHQSVKAPVSTLVSIPPILINAGQSAELSSTSPSITSTEQNSPGFVQLSDRNAPFGSKPSLSQPAPSALASGALPPSQSPRTTGKVHSAVQTIESLYLWPSQHHVDWTSKRHPKSLRLGSNTDCMRCCQTYNKMPLQAETARSAARQKAYLKLKPVSISVHRQKLRRTHSTSDVLERRVGLEVEDFQSSSPFEPPGTRTPRPPSGSQLEEIETPDLVWESQETLVGADINGGVESEVLISKTQLLEDQENWQMDLRSDSSTSLTVLSPPSASSSHDESMGHSDEDRLVTNLAEEDDKQAHDWQVARLERKKPFLKESARVVLSRGVDRLLDVPAKANVPLELADDTSFLFRDLWPRQWSQSSHSSSDVSNESNGPADLEPAIDNALSSSSSLDDVPSTAATLLHSEKIFVGITQKPRSSSTHFAPEEIVYTETMSASPTSTRRGAVSDMFSEGAARASLVHEPSLPSLPRRRVARSASNDSAVTRRRWTSSPSDSSSSSGSKTDSKCSKDTIPSSPPLDDTRPDNVSWPSRSSSSSYAWESADDQQLQVSEVSPVAQDLEAHTRQSAKNSFADISTHPSMLTKHLGAWITSVDLQHRDSTGIRRVNSFPEELNRRASLAEWLPDDKDPFSPSRTISPDAESDCITKDELARKPESLQSKRRLSVLSSAPKIAQRSQVTNKPKNRGPRWSRALVRPHVNGDLTPASRRARHTRQSGIGTPVRPLGVLPTTTAPAPAASKTPTRRASASSSPTRNMTPLGPQNLAGALRWHVEDFFSLRNGREWKITFPANDITFMRSQSQDADTSAMPQSQPMDNGHIVMRIEEEPLQAPGNDKPVPEGGDDDAGSDFEDATEASDSSFDTAVEQGNPTLNAPQDLPLVDRHHFGRGSVWSDPGLSAPGQSEAADGEPQAVSTSNKKSKGAFESIKWMFGMLQVLFGILRILLAMLQMLFDLPRKLFQVLYWPLLITLLLITWDQKQVWFEANAIEYRNAAVRMHNTERWGHPWLEKQVFELVRKLDLVHEVYGM